MDTPMVATRAFGRPPLAGLGKLTVAALIGIVLMLIIVQAALIGHFDLSVMIAKIVTLLIAGVVALGAAGRRRMDCCSDRHEGRRHYFGSVSSGSHASKLLGHVK